MGDIGWKRYAIEINGIEASWYGSREREQALEDFAYLTGEDTESELIELVDMDSGKVIGSKFRSRRQVA